MQIILEKKKEKRIGPSSFIIAIYLGSINPYKRNDEAQ
jgi:hypothetical protein